MKIKTILLNSNVFLLVGMLIFLYLWMNNNAVYKKEIKDLKENREKSEQKIDSLKIEYNKLAKLEKKHNKKITEDSIKIETLKENIDDLHYYYNKKLSDLSDLTPNEHYDAITNLLNEE